MFAKQILPRLLAVALISVSVIWLISSQHIVLDPLAISEAIKAVSRLEIAGAIGLTTLSFLAISLYDVVALRLFRHPLPTAFAARVGFTAIALGQMLGFGIVVATFVRWRHYRSYGLDIVKSGTVSAFIAIGFLFALVQILAIAGMIEPEQVAVATGVLPHNVVFISALCFLSGLIFISLCYLQPAFQILGYTPKFPRFRAIRLMFVLALLDVIPAACVLWILLPAGSITFAAMLPIFMAAMAMGLASNTPGGVGILEIIFLVAMPQIPPNELIASLILFRAVYYGLPFLLASCLLLENEWQNRIRANNFPASERRTNPLRAPDIAPLGAGGLSPVVSSILSTGTRAEDALVWLRDKEVLLSKNRQSFIMFADQGNSLIALSNPIGYRQNWHQMLTRFEAEAKLRMTEPVFYKVGAEFAAFLERNGYMTSVIGHEAIIDVQNFNMEIPARRELRRKCRKATKSGVSFLLHPAGKTDLSKLKPVSDKWLEAKGDRERGYSLGRFDTSYLAQFDILEARQDNETVAFLSIQKSGDGNEWAIDLMRSVASAPQGTMQALIVNALELARLTHATRLSLCAVALAPLNDPVGALEKLSAYFYKTKGARSGLEGLYRFKQSFAPEWEPVYLASRSKTLPLSAIISVRQVIEAPA